MKEQNLQQTVLTLYQQGQSKRAIARLLKISVKTVRAIISKGFVQEPKVRIDKVVVDDTVLEKLYHECTGHVERIHEKLTEEQGVSIGYSTLTRLVRSIGLGVTPKKRAAHVEDIPGDEMQHDTTVYTMVIGGIQRKVICSGIYLRYSKMRYVRFYPQFNRFVMKCFFDEALRFWGYSAHTCVIDNTNLAVLYGSGSSAVMNPEMVAFASNYGFTWKAHAINHPNRKAGKERNFWTVETNFLPGRTFSSFDNLNEQAIQWATVRYAKRPQSKTKLIPVELFEYEKPSLIKLPVYITAPYLPLRRRIDAYGYVVFDVNYFWVPTTVGSTHVTVLQYAKELCIMDGTKELIRYKIPAQGVRNKRFIPDGVTRKPYGEPKDRKLGCVQEEKRLREMGASVNAYLDFIKSSSNNIKKKPAFIRGLYTLSKQIGVSLFVQTIERAHGYRVNALLTLRSIADQLVQCMVSDQCPFIMETADDYQKRTSYKDGQFTQENDNDNDYNL